MTAVETMLETQLRFEEDPFFDAVEIETNNNEVITEIKSVKKSNSVKKTCTNETKLTDVSLADKQTEKSILTENAEEKVNFEPEKSSKNKEEKCDNTGSDILNQEIDEVSLEECLENGRKLMTMFVDNKFEEVLEVLEKHAQRSMIHRLGAAAVRFFDSILSMDKDKMSIALASMKQAADNADSHRKKTGYINYIFNPDYNTFDDMESHAELCYAIAQLVTGLLTVLEDQSVYGFVNGGLKIRMAYSAFRECANILKNKITWESQVVRMHFESGARLGIGAFDLIISFFPSKLAKLLEYIGFNSDRDLAIQELTQAVSLVDGLHYDISSILLSSYYGFLEYFYGLGESGTDFFDYSAKIWHKRTPNSSIVKIGLGIREMLLGQPDKAIVFFKECIEGQSFWIQLHYACYWEICWAHAMKSDWENAAKYAMILKDDCKWSPAMFTYLYAVFLFMDMQKRNKPELSEQISEELKKIPKLKRKLGGKRAFHEKIVIERSKKFNDRVDELLLPPFELLYIWNLFHMMAKEPKLLLPMLEDVESKLKIFTKDLESTKTLDQYCYLIFMKGVMCRHLKRHEEALILFDEVVSCKKKIKEETHLLPQSCFETGMLYREMGKPMEAKKWLKKARDDYSDYLTESMIQYRVQWALDLIKKEQV